jgi:hypothetical protein
MEGQELFQICDTWNVVRIKGRHYFQCGHSFAAGEHYIKNTSLDDMERIHMVYISRSKMSTRGKEVSNDL